jgi:hypothetical protein
MSVRKATLTATAGPNTGDSVSLEVGSCRLIGRHLSEHETAFIDRHGNRLLDPSANELIQKHLEKHVKPITASKITSFSTETFARGADVIFADDSISRAHAMVFCDHKSVGVIDLASTNGTFVNGERVASAVLSEDDVLTIGKTELTLKIR